MRKIIVLALIAFAVSAVAMMQAEPAYAAQTTAQVSSAVSAVDTVVGTQSPIPVQLVRGMHGGSGRMAFSRGAGRSFRAARFNNFRFHNAGFRHFRPFVYGSVFPYYSSYYYNGCYWNGYTWVCDDTY
jgi:hypothetical protein